MKRAILAAALVTAAACGSGSTMGTLCTPGEGIVVCTTDDGGTVKFSQASIDAYTPDEAAAYASSHTNL